MDPSSKPCPFCDPSIRGRVIAELGTVFGIRDAYPVTPGHSLIIPRRHVLDFFTMTDEEHRDMFAFFGLLRERLLAEDPEITGFNFGMNCGRSAGQTVPHAHLHLIPRRDGDCEKPQGGVRGVIPGRQAY